MFSSRNSGRCLPRSPLPPLIPRNQCPFSSRFALVDKPPIFSSEQQQQPQPQRHRVDSTGSIMCPGYEQRGKPWAAAAALLDPAQDDQEHPNEAQEVEDEEEEDSLGWKSINRRPSSYYFDRQMYLRSYTFRRKMSVCERLRGGVRRIESAAWAVIQFTTSTGSGGGKNGSKRQSRFRGKIFSLSFKPRCIRFP